MKKIYAYIGSSKGENSNTFIYVKKLLSETKKLFGSDLNFDIFT